MRRTFALCVLLFVAHSGTNGQSDEKTDCSKLDFTDLPKDCCKTPFGTHFNPEKLTAAFKECKSNPKLIEWLNSYKLNTLQQQDLKNFVDVNSTSTIKELCSAGAFVECVAKYSYYVFDNGTLDTNVVFGVLEPAAPDAKWKKIVNSVFLPISPGEKTYAFTDILEDRFEKIKCTSGTVNLVPLMFAQLLQSEFIWMCPQQNVYNSKNKCAETMKNFQYCDGKIFSPTAKGVFFFPSV